MTSHRKETGKVRAWAVYSKEGKKCWVPLYEAHFIKSSAKNTLKEFEDSNSYRTNIKFKIVKGFFIPINWRKKK